MEIRATTIADAYEFVPRQHSDERGVFLEWFRESSFIEATGREFALRQANISVSRRGTVRGIHFADVPPGQAKYVTAVAGSVLDVVVDLRVGSPTFGQWDSVLLDDRARNAVFLAEGLGHGFCALSDNAVVSYLCTEGYAPARERGVDPRDAELAIDWSLPAKDLLLSPKDAAAPSLAAARESGLLPDWEVCSAYYREQEAATGT